MRTLLSPSALILAAAIALTSGAVGLAAPTTARAASCGKVAAAGASRIKTTKVSCRNARRFVRAWSNSCRGQGQGNVTGCVIGLPSRQRVTLNCVGTSYFGSFLEKCASRSGKYRIRFEADL